MTGGNGPVGARLNFRIRVMVLVQVNAQTGLGVVENPDRPGAGRHGGAGRQRLHLGMLPPLGPEIMLNLGLQGRGYRRQFRRRNCDRRLIEKNNVPGDHPALLSCCAKTRRSTDAAPRTG